MTREENLIKHIQYALDIGADITLTDDDAKFIIKALKQEPKNQLLDIKVTTDEAARAIQELVKAGMSHEDIQALEQEPCRDTISRQTVLDTTICEGISCNECSFNDIDGESGCLLHHRISELPPVSPARPKGKWVEISKFSHSYKCSVCGRTLINITDGKNNVAKHYPFCHCGADMRGDNNEND